MPGVFPDSTSGSLVIRDTAGVATNPPTVINAFSPPAAFSASGSLTAFPTGCLSRFSPEQMNAIVSELVAFAAELNPTGSWTLSSLNNLAANFAIWRASIPSSDVHVVSGSYAAGTITLTLSDASTVPIDVSGIFTEVKALATVQLVDAFGTAIGTAFP